MISDIADPMSLPKDYDQTLASYTQKGFRVLGCAFRLLTEEEASHIQSLSRTTVETDTHFLGTIPHSICK